MSPVATPAAEILWSADGPDRVALARRHDWSALSGLERLWPELAARHGEAVALEAPHARHPESLSYSELQQRIEAAAAAFATLGVRPCLRKTAPAGCRPIRV
jgi:long-chain acyl-CoA synthetase